MTHRAGNTVASQSAVLAVSVVGESVDHAVFEWLLLVRLDLPLAHYAVTAIAGVIEESGLAWAQGLFRFKWRVKDGIASGQSHHPRGPFRTGRKIHPRARSPGEPARDAFFAS